MQGDGITFIIAKPVSINVYRLIRSSHQGQQSSEVFVGISMVRSDGDRHAAGDNGFVELPLVLHHERTVGMVTSVNSRKKGRGPRWCNNGLWHRASLGGVESNCD